MNLIKMKKLKISGLLFSLGVLFAGCEKVIEAKDLPQQDSRLVLNCIIYTDSNITANISASKSILSGKDYKRIDDAVCDLYEDDVFMQTMVNAKNGYYLSSVIGKSNKKYTIQVAAPSYKNIDATTSTLGNIAVTNITRYDTINSYYTVNSYNNDYYSLSGQTRYQFRIIDDLTRKNYYSLRPIVEFLDSLGNPIDLQSGYGISLNTTNNNLGDNYYGSSFVDIDDLKIVNGKEIDVDLNISLYANSDKYFFIKTINVWLELYNNNEDYYKYKTTFLDQATTSISLFAEPVQVFGNVNNGMGILAGVSLNRVLIYSGTPSQ